MGKKLTIFSVIILVIGLAVLGFYIQQGRKRLQTDPFKAISPASSIVIETVDLQSFLNSLTTGKGLFGELGKIKELAAFEKELGFLADQLNKPAYKQLTDGATILISFTPDGEGSLNPLLTAGLPATIRLRHLKEILHSSGIGNITETKSGSLEMLGIPFDVNERSDTLFFSIASGLLLCSKSGTVVQDAAAQMTGEGDIRDLPGFSRVHLASGKNADKIFVVFSNLPEMIRRWLLPGSKDLAARVPGLAGTAGSDIYINENGVVLSGYTESTDSTNYLYKFKYITPRELHNYKILPSATVLFETYIIPEAGQQSARMNQGQGPSAHLAEKLKECTGEEITKAIVDIKNQPLEANSLVVYEMTNRVRAEEILLEELGPKPEIDFFEPDDQVKLPVYKTSFTKLSGILKPGFVSGFDETYFTFYDNFMISGSSYATVCRLLYDNLLNKTLANDLIYRDFESTLPSRSGYFFYCVPSRMTGYLSRFLNDNIIAALKANKASLNKLQSAGYQLASSNGMVYNSLSLRFKEDAREESTTEWETLLDTVAAIKPFFFTNHITGVKEIFIQDLNNNTYLINAAGRVLWKVPLRERITGNIYMVDYFRNGKYQLLFSGKNYLHLLDRNGNYVERYPVRLRSAATNSLAIFDYDNNLNYRLFIAGEDKMIYSYDKTGSVVKGWQPFRTAGTVISEVAYFKVSGKDYIVASDDNSVYFLDRRGNKRLNLSQPVTRAKGSAIRLTPGSDPSVVCTAPDGTIQHIYFDGTVRKFSLKQFSAEHSFDIFDINGDGFGEYIFIDKGVLYLYSHERAKLFSRDFGSDNIGGPITFVFSGNDRKIGLFDVTKNLIYLIDAKGRTMEGFPLRGASMFSIGKLSDRSGWHLIVGGTDRFLYNYKIETDKK